MRLDLAHEGGPTHVGDRAGRRDSVNVAFARERPFSSSCPRDRRSGVGRPASAAGARGRSAPTHAAIYVEHAAPRPRLRADGVSSCSRRRARGSLRVRAFANLTVEHPRSRSRSSPPCEATVCLSHSSPTIEQRNTSNTMSGSTSSKARDRTRCGEHLPVVLPARRSVCSAPNGCRHRSTMAFCYGIMPARGGVRSAEWRDASVGFLEQSRISTRRRM